MTAPTLPTPVVTTPHSWFADEKGRSRKITYTVVEPTAETEGAAVIVTCAHNKGTKSFWTTVQPVVLGKKESGPFSGSSYMGFSGFNCGKVPVARFSAKALEAYTEKTLAAIPVIVEQDPEVAAMFADPAAASTRMFGRES